MSDLAARLGRIPGNPRLWVNGFLALVILWLLLLIVLLLFQRTEKEDKLAINAPAQNDVFRWSWFGGNGQAVVRQASTEQLEESRLKAELLGVVIGRDNATATIKFAGQPEAVYHIGDKLRSGVELKEVEVFRVIITENGIRRQISLQKADNVMQSGDFSSNSDAQQRQQGLALANMFGAVPVQTVDFGAGLKLNRVSPELKQLGEVEDGDVVVRIGGEAVSQLMARPDPLSEFEGQITVPITVLRDGAEVEININAASLSARIQSSLKGER